MSIKEEGGMKERETIQADLQIIKHEIIKDAESTRPTEAASHNLILYHACVILNFVDSEASQ